MPGRKYSSASSYRYGFNGKENDNEVKGEGNQQDYGMRIYDPRLVRFLSVDPIAGDYPELTPYQFAGNRVIMATDIDGLEPNPFSMRAAMNIHETSLIIRAQKGDKDAARELAMCYSVNTKIAFLQIQTATAITTVISGGASGGLNAYIKRTLISGALGAGINSAFSYYQGDEGYDLIKAGVSGFVSGAILGAFKNAEWLSVGYSSASAGEMVNQAFDNTFGYGNGSYDLGKILSTGGIGAVANILSNNIVNAAENTINRRVTKQISETYSPSYKEKITKAIKLESPRIGTQALKKKVKSTLKEIRNLIKKQGDLEKQAITQAVERAVDYLQQKVPIK